jgi:hypothetical protein
VVEVNDERQRCIFIQKERVVLVPFNHIADSITIAVNGGVHPPPVLNWFTCGVRLNRHCQSDSGEKE